MHRATPHRTHHARHASPRPRPAHAHLGAVAAGVQPALEDAVRERARGARGAGPALAELGARGPAVGDEPGVAAPGLLERVGEDALGPVVRARPRAGVDLVLFCVCVCVWLVWWGGGGEGGRGGCERGTKKEEEVESRIKSSFSAPRVSSLARSLTRALSLFLSPLAGRGKKRKRRGGKKERNYLEKKTPTRRESERKKSKGGKRRTSGKMKREKRIPSSAFCTPALTF